MASRAVSCCNHASRSARQERAAAHPSVPVVRRRSALLLALAAPVALRQSAANAFGLESAPRIELPSDAAAVAAGRSVKRETDAKLTESAFRDSDLLRVLRERSEMNREENARKIADKYCRRQAEMGVGDCAGLQLIPGMTRSGLQKDAPKPWERQLVENISGFFSSKSNKAEGS